MDQSKKYNLVELHEKEMKKDSIEMELFNYIQSHPGLTAQSIRSPFKTLFPTVQPLNRILYKMHYNGLLRFYKSGTSAPQWYVNLEKETITSATAVTLPSTTTTTTTQTTRVTPSTVSGVTSTPPQIQERTIAMQQVKDYFLSGADSSSSFVEPRLFPSDSTTPTPTPTTTITLPELSMEELITLQPLSISTIAPSQMRSKDASVTYQEHVPSELFAKYEAIMQQKDQLTKEELKKQLTDMFQSGNPVEITTKNHLEIYIDCSSAATLIYPLEAYCKDLVMKYLSYLTVKIHLFPDIKYNGYGVGTPPSHDTVVWQHPLKQAPSMDTNVTRSTTVMALTQAVFRSLEESIYPHDNKRILIVSHPNTVFAGLKYFVVSKGFDFLLSCEMSEMISFLSPTDKSGQSDPFRTHLRL